jgi:NAD(P)-dependent dehydrogenase (short-subunit alcohol dehydrogenase family)
MQDDFERRIGTSERPDLPIALVIGAGGMGMATARRLGQHCRVVLADLSAERLARGEAALHEDGVDAVGVRCDVTDPASVAQLAEFVASRGQLRTLAHVAGLAPTMGDWDLILNVDLVGAALMERAILPLASAGTAAVFISSLAAHSATPPTPAIARVLDDPLAPDFTERLAALVPERNSLQAYAYAKGGMIRMVRQRAFDWGQKGARIVSVSPGLIATPQGAQEFQGPNRERKLDRLRRTPLAREGTMVEIVDAIEFLASSRASFISGTDILVDGGAMAASQPEKGPYGSIGQP